MDKPGMKKYIHRSIEPVLRMMLKQFPAVALTGPRQSGKSTLLQHALPAARYVTLDDPVVLQQALNDPELVLGSEGEVVVIDEIQYAPSLLSYVKLRIDQKRQAKGRFVLTGSQQFALIKNLGRPWPAGSACWNSCRLTWRKPGGRGSGQTPWRASGMPACGGCIPNPT